MSEKKRSDEINRISELLKEISNGYFRELIRVQADLLIQKDSFRQSEKREAPSEEDRRIKTKQYCNTLNGNYFNLLNDGIFRYMTGQPPSSTDTDGSQASALSDTAAAKELVTYFDKGGAKLWGLSFDTFINILKALFIETGRQNYNNVEHLNDEKISSCIAKAIQDIVIGTPQRISDSDGLRVSKEIEACLVDILQKIEPIRKDYIRVINIPLLTFEEAIKDLRSLIGLTRADNSVKLPLREGPVGYPLVGDKLALYARGKNDVDTLKNTIVRNRGFILVTGYAGVGKSTFINLVSSKLLEVPSKFDNDLWQVVPIEVNLAEATTFFWVLQECIRKLHPVLTAATEQGITKLEKDEKDILDQAYRSVKYKYKELNTNSEGTSAQLSGSTGLPDKVSKLVSAPFTAVVQGSKYRKKTSERTTESWPYDEGEARRHIEDLTKKLAHPRRVAKGNVKIKLAFIFEGIDKVDNEVKKSLLEHFLKLPNSISLAVFLFVTCYDLWTLKLSPECRFVVPLFTTKETVRYLQKVILLSPQEKLKSEQEKFIQEFASYLTYHAQGIPREIISELGSKINANSDLAYITIPPKDKNLFHMYDLLQQALEKVMTGLSTDETNRGESNYSEEERDRIQRGLYVLIGELINQGSLDLVSLGPEADVTEGHSNNLKGIFQTHEFDQLTNIFRDNFRNILKYYEFNRLVEDLANSLKYIEIAGDKIFPRNEQDEKITVSETFYALIGSRTVQSKRAKAKGKATSGIEENLNKKEATARGLALGDLKQYWNEYPELRENRNIATCLYDIFLTQSEEHRKDAAHCLSGRAFFENVNKNTQPLDKFIQQETEPELLKEFIRLIKEGANSNSQNRQDGTTLLLELLSRHLSPDIKIKAIDLLADICETDDLEQVVKSLDKRQDEINADDLLRPLIALSKKSSQNLISLLFTHNFTAISTATLKKLLSEQDDDQMTSLWLLVSKEENRKNTFAKQIMIAILRRLSEVEPELKNLEGAVLEWLNSIDEKSAVDQGILRVAVRENPRLPSRLETYAKQSGQEVAYKKLDAIIHPQPPSLQPPPSQGNWGVVGATVFAAFLAVIYFAIPYDLPAHATLVSRLFARFLELIGVNAGLLGLVGIISILEFIGVSVGLWRLVRIIASVIPSAKSVEKRRIWFIFTIIFIVLAVICFLAQISTHSLVYTLLGQLILAGLAALIFWLPFGVWIATRENPIGS